MVRAWALAEVASPTSPMQQRSEFDPVRATLRDGGTLSQSDWQLLERGIRWARQPMLDPLLELHLTWYRGHLPIDVLADARTIRFPAYLEKAPSRRLGDYCAAESRPSPEREFRREAMTAPPILAGETLQGRWCLVEGYRRCCRAIRDHRASCFDGLPLPVIAGIHTAIMRWLFW